MSNASFVANYHITHNLCFSSGTHADIVGDFVCVLANAGVSKAVCIGHDWGSQLCYEAARMRPDLFEAVVGAAIPVSRFNSSICLHDSHRL